MRHLKSLRLCVAAMVCIIGIAAGCSNSESATADDQAMFALPEGTAVTASFTDARVPGMKGVVENDRLQLYVNEDTAEIAVFDKRSGAVWRSNPEARDADTLASGINKDMLSAQARINFFNSLGQISSVNTYTDSTAYGQIAFEEIPGGIRVTYQLGKDEQGVDDMPQMLSKERYEEITSQLDNTGQRALLIAYAEDRETGVYVRNDNALSGLQLQRALDAFEAVGYTAEDLAQDNAEHNLDDSIPVPRIFGLSIEYTLDGDNLLVRMPVDSIRYPEAYPVNNITLLNFFGAGGSEETGSLFVPDGSGALIHFNNGKFKYPAYQQDVYGRDLTMDRTDFLSRDQKIRLPVFGIIREDTAYLGIIEQGASAAMINADVSGRLNSFNYVHPSFYFRNKEDVTLNAGSQQRSLPKFQEDPMKTDYVVRYAFLNEEEASYSGMASYYRQYLTSRQMLPESGSASGGEVPFYLQLIGSIETKKHFLGVPYRAQEPLTTFEEAKSIVTDLQDRNIRNIKLKYTGWFNGGLNHTTPDKIRVNGSIGGGNGLQGLQAFAAAEDITLFPDVGILRVYNTKGFNESRQAARRLTEAPAAVYPIDMAINRRDRDREPSYILSPRLVSGTTHSMLSGLQDLELDSVSLRDLADQLNSDYRKNRQIDRAESEAISIEALQAIREAGFAIMAEGGNAYALPYVTDITNAPLSNSGFKLEDEMIPFYQMVIRGAVDYTGEPYNLSTFTNARQYILKCLEYGSGIYFTWMNEPNYKVKDTDFDYLYAVHYQEWIGLAKEMYQEVNGVLMNVIGQPIIDHEKLDNGVFRTVYGNGRYVIVNYNLTPVTVDGLTIEAESFATGGERS